MISEISPFVKFYGFLLLAGLIAACGTDEHDNEYDSIEAPEVELTHVFDITDSDETMMSNIVDVQIASDELILLTDWQQSQVHVYDDNGQYLHSFLGSGGGPGEVESMGQTLLTPDDQFFVLDFSTRSISQFTRSSNEWNFETRVALRDFFPSWYYPIDEDSWLIHEAGTPWTVDEEDSLFVKQIDHDGDELAELVGFPIGELITIDGGGGPVSAMSPAYHPRNIFEFGDGYLIHNYSEHLAFTFYEIPSMEVTGSFHLERPAYPLSSETKEEYAGRFTDSQLPVDNIEQMIYDQMRDEKAVVRNFTYDSTGYIWAQLHGEDGKHPWIILDKEGNVLANSILEFDGGDLRTVHAGRVYIRSEDDSGLPMVEVYEYEI